MREVELRPAPLTAYAGVLGDARTARLRAGADRAARLLDGRTVWNVNSTATGGGVAELLQTQVPLARALGLDARWLVIDGDPAFFAITKRLCTRVYGAAGDGGPLGPAELDHYRRTTAANAEALGARVRPGDLVIVHEAQPAGLVAAAKALGATVVWRGHTGSDVANAHTRDGWAFARRFVEVADATVFLTAGHVPAWAPRPHVIPPSIDPCSPKNMALDRSTATALLRAVGVLDGARPCR